MFSRAFLRSSFDVFSQLSVSFILFSKFCDIGISDSNFRSIRFYIYACCWAYPTNCATWGKNFIQNIQVRFLSLTCVDFLCNFDVITPLRGICLAIPSEHMNHDSPSFIFSCSSWARLFAAQITFSITGSEHEAVSAHCSSVKYDLPGIVSSSK